MERVFSVLGLAALLSLAEWLQLVALAAVLVGLFAIGRVRRKDGTIADLEAAVRAQETLIEAKERELEGVQDRANLEHDQRRACEQQVARLQGELATMERYTAQGALEQVGRELAALQAAVVSAIQGQGDLILETHTILREISDTLAVNRRAIETLIDRGSSQRP